MGKNNNHEHINDVMNNEISKSTTISTVEDIKSKTQVNDLTAYIIAQDYTVNPWLLIGQIIEVRKNEDGECPTRLNATNSNFEFSASALKGINVDEQTKSSTPQLRGSFIVNNDLCGKISFLTFLSAQLEAKETFSLVVMDQAKGVVLKDDAWDNALLKWQNDNQKIMDDPSICYVYVITGFVQKDIIKKKYRMFDGQARGGAYGLNIEGKLSTDVEEYSLDTVFGLTPAILKRPPSLKIQKAGFEKIPDQIIATHEELILFAQSSGRKYENK